MKMTFPPATMDVHLAELLQVESLVEQLYERLQRVNAAALKQVYGAAVVKLVDVETLRQEKKCLEDDYHALQEKYTKLKEDASVKEDLVEMLSSQVKEHSSEINKWSDRVASLESETEAIRQSALRRGWENGHRDGVTLGLQRGYRAGYMDFLKGADLSRLMKDYRAKLFERLWHSRLFVEKRGNTIVTKIDN